MESQVPVKIQDSFSGLLKHKSNPIITLSTTRYLLQGEHYPPLLKYKMFIWPFFLFLVFELYLVCLRSIITNSNLEPAKNIELFNDENEMLQKPWKNNMYLIMLIILVYKSKWILILYKIVIRLFPESIKCILEIFSFIFFGCPKLWPLL